MKFAWQQSRGEALYVETNSAQIFGIIRWKEENRLNIEAEYVGPRGSKTRGTASPFNLGLWANELKAKEAVQNHVNELFPPEEKPE